jgi:CBS domain-containing protein
VTEKEVKTIFPEEDVRNILKSVGEPGPTMLPVVENGKLVGVVTKADLLPMVKSKDPIYSIMKRKVYTVSLNDRVIHARRIMISENIARLPVLEEKKLVGIISDIEIALALASLKKSFSLGKQKHHLDELLVEDAMRAPVVWTTPSVSIFNAAQLMLNYNIGALPVLENEKLVGMVTRTDLLKTIVT